MLCIGVFPFPSRHKRVVQSTEEEITSRRKDLEGLGDGQHRQKKNRHLLSAAHPELPFRDSCITTELHKKYPPRYFLNTLEHF